MDLSPREIKEVSRNVTTRRQEGLAAGYSRIHNSVRENGPILPGPFSPLVRSAPDTGSGIVVTMGSLERISLRADIDEAPPCHPAKKDQSSRYHNVDVI